MEERRKENERKKVEMVESHVAEHCPRVLRPVPSRPSVYVLIFQWFAVVAE